jgi:hypothetical protein
VHTSRSAVAAAGSLTSAAPSARRRAAAGGVAVCTATTLSGRRVHRPRGAIGLARCRAWGHSVDAYGLVDVHVAVVARVGAWSAATIDARDSGRVTVHDDGRT